MLGRTHALSGAVAYTAIAPLAHATPIQIAAGAACTAGAALLPDLDHPNASATRTLGPLTQTIGWAVRILSGGHRHGTHSVFGIAAFTGAAWTCSLNPYTAMAALWLLAALAVRAFRRRDPVLERLIIAAAAAAGAWWLTTSHHLQPGFLPLAVGLGVAAHLLGDAMTEQGLHPLWPVSRWHLRLATIDTGKAVELWLIVPALALGLVLLLWHAAGTDLIHSLSSIALTGATP